MSSSQVPRPPSARSASSSASRAPSTPFDAGQKNVWTDVIDHNKSVAKQRGDSGRPDGVLFVVGSRGCGKTTLVNRLLYPDKTEVPKPTEGMEYNYARRASSGAGGGGGVDRKDVAHVWEIAGSRHFADEVTEQDNVFLGPRHVTTAVVAICVDLAKPHEAMRTAEYWLGRVHARCAKTFEKLAARGSRLPEQLVRRSERVFAGGGGGGGGTAGGAHEDAHSPLVRHSGVTVLIVATKHDAWRRTDPERMKVLVRALRFLAHANAAGLFFLGGFGAGDEKSAHGDGDGADDTDAYPGEMRSQFNQFRAYLNHLMFAGADRKFPGRIAAKLDHLRPVTCPVGGDRLSSIGVPKGAESGGEPLRAWRDVTSRMFPPPRDGDGDFEGSKVAGTAPDLSKFPEREVDVAARTAAAELAAFRRSQAMLRAGGGGGGRPRSAAVR